MGERPKLWLLSAGLLAVAAVLVGVAAASYWQPCVADWPEFSQACLVAMDESSGFPLPVGTWTVVGALGLIATLTLAVAWLVLLPTMPLSRWGRVVAVLPAAAVVAVAISAVMSTFDPTGDWMPSWLYLAVDLAAVPAVFALANSGVAGALLVRYVVVALASTAVGLVHQLADYIASLSMSTANWDTPPGSGLFTAAALLVAAVATAILWRAQGNPSRRPTADATAPAITTTM
jgi:hypothetical protein